MRHGNYLPMMNICSPVVFRLFLVAIFVGGCAVQTQRAEWQGQTSVQTNIEKDNVDTQSDVTVVEPERTNQAAKPSVSSESVPVKTKAPLAEICEKTLNALPGSYDTQKLKTACARVRTVDGCHSFENRDIFHYQKTGGIKARRILVFGGVHGDEQPGASVARQWMVRLADIEPRNTWRIIPVLNPDGTINGTRTNARKVDINRNFPSADWEKAALKYWKSRVGSNPRKYPGASAGSEVETRCAVKHIQTFEPDLIIAIHTPLGVLDFDGPEVDFPKADLPWIRLGHFPGSLGRYMWRDRKVPVLTVELRGNAVRRFEQFDRLQDVSGTVALKAQRALKSQN